MTRSATIRWVCCAFVMLLSTISLASGQTLTPDADGFIVANPEDLQPPEGSRSVRILGRSSESGMYIMRITFAAGTGTRPHFHDQARYLTVIEGTWWVALGPEASTYRSRQDDSHESWELSVRAAERHSLRPGQRRSGDRPDHGYGACEDDPDRDRSVEADSRRSQKARGSPSWPIPAPTVPR